MAGELSLETASPGTKEVRDIPSRNPGHPSSNLGSGIKQKWQNGNASGCYPDSP